MKSDTNCIQTICLAFMLLILIGCKSRNPNPELLDPIYKDLTSIYKESEKLVKELEKNQLENMKELELAGANGMDLKVARKKIRETSQKINQATQMRDYSRIRMEMRRVNGRRAYFDAYSKDKPWPEPSEYQNYLTHKRLKGAPMNWSSRVPKNNDRYIASKPEKIKK